MTSDGKETAMKLITAIVRTTNLEAIVKSLERSGIRGMTISEVKGTGQQVPLFKPYTIHNRIDIFIPDAKVDEVTRIILDHASTGLAGDGCIALQPVECIIKIRTREKIECPL
jgi:nitrogen regulatory protein P-II 1